jgi:hypothetical protein
VLAAQEGGHLLDADAAVGQRPDGGDALGQFALLKQGVDVSRPVSRSIRRG